MIRGIRGAITIINNNKDEILAATRDLVSCMTERNGIDAEDISCIIFTVTPDITAAFPASAVRLQGEPWSHLACIDVQQMDSPDGMKGVIRALMQVETEKKLDEIIHPYLRDAIKLRPDRANLS